MHRGAVEHFLLAYGDGVRDMDIPVSIVDHRRSGTVCTSTAVHPPVCFGVRGTTEGGSVEESDKMVTADQNRILDILCGQPAS